MCGQIKFNLIISVTSAHFWPLRDRENCDALYFSPNIAQKCKIRASMYKEALANSEAQRRNLEHFSRRAQRAS